MSAWSDRQSPGRLVSTQSEWQREWSINSTRIDRLLNSTHRDFGSRWVCLFSAFWLSVKKLNESIVFGLSVRNGLSSLVFVGWGEGVNIALSIFGWGALRDWLSSLCDVSGGQLGCFQGCVSSSEMNKGWWKRILCITISVTFWYLSLMIGLVSSVTKWILGTEAPLGVFNLLCLACCQLEGAFGVRLSSLMGCTEAAELAKWPWKKVHTFGLIYFVWVHYYRDLCSCYSKT